MSYFAAAATRADDSWDAVEVDLDGVTDLDDVVDRLRDVDSSANISLLFVEADDEYLTVLRLDNGDDLRVFCSDAPFAEESRLGGILLSDTDTDTSSSSDDDDEETPVRSELDAEPVGETDLLTDLGVSASVLLELCAKDGMLPSDVTVEVASRIGFSDVLEEVHDA
ncbi:tRNA adenosine deaminase-associated protein [Stackebrandtia soli]|uniref:tRNA adenosine deaminase-associated protein n=1 Tax=Stackebrandtia soli TaxID=1892856 RepID=UPI0039EBDB73